MGKGYNPYRDAKGRFASGPSGSGGGTGGSSSRKYSTSRTGDSLLITRAAVGRKPSRSAEIIPLDLGGPKRVFGVRVGVVGGSPKPGNPQFRARVTTFKSALRAKKAALSYLK